MRKPCSRIKDGDAGHVFTTLTLSQTDSRRSGHPHRATSSFIQEKWHSAWGTDVPRLPSVPPPLPASYWSPDGADGDEQDGVLQQTTSLSSLMLMAKSYMRAMKRATRLISRGLFCRLCLRAISSIDRRAIAAQRPLRERSNNRYNKMAVGPIIAQILHDDASYKWLIDTRPLFWGRSGLSQTVVFVSAFVSDDKNRID